MNKQKVFSFWEKDFRFDDIDAAIIGAGIVGLSAAIHFKLANPKLRIVVIEASNWPYGASTKNAGFACFGSAGEILDNMKKMSQQEVMDLISMRWEGLTLLKSLVREDQMEYQNCGGAEIFNASEEMKFQGIESQLQDLNKLVKEAVGLNDTFSIEEQAYGFKTFSQVIVNQYEGCLHPVKMIDHLLTRAKNLGVSFHWNTNISKYNDLGNQVVLETDHSGELKTKKLFLCTNAFTLPLMSDIDLKPARNQVLITEPLTSIKLDRGFHYDRGYTYFRNYKNRILIGGARNLDLANEQTSEYGENSMILSHLETFLRETIIPGQAFKIAETWSGIIGIGDRKIPIIRQLTDNVFAGVRMGGMGVAIGSLIGKKLSAFLS